MNCPSCQTVMREREKGDIIIDVCPNCRGVWLDAGELEKLSEREQRYYDDDRRRRDNNDDDDYDDDDDDGGGLFAGGQGRGGRRQGFLSSVFDAFGGGGD